ncbi:MAG: substrate-binding domain-containing protein [Spirochaetaceae bacterium]|nr:substrate-binding domain-containing protein [Spirochaetaceae bacterium]
MSNKIRNNNLHIGILTIDMENKYPELVWKSLKKFAEMNQINITFFVGNALKSPYGSESGHNVIYDQINPALFDGLIMVSGVLANFISLDEYTTFIESLGKIPIVSLSIKINNIPSILIDNKSGIRDCVSHLIIDHGYKHIAFLKGPSGQQEADERYEAYLEVLGENNIECDPKLVLPCDFSKESSLREVKKLLESENRKIDAIVCANDEMALGVYEIFENRGIKIPHEIAVTGFDNLLISSNLYPPLTTIKHPFDIQAQKAFETLLSIINKEKTLQEMRIPTQLVIRRSCGCFNQLIKDIDSTAIDTEKRSQITDIEIPELYSKIKSELTRTVDRTSEIQSSFNRFGEELISLFICDLQKGGKPSEFIKYLDILLSHPGFSEEYLLDWETLLSILHKEILRFYQDSSIIPRSEDLFNKAMALIGDLIIRMTNYQNFQEWEYSFLNNIVTRELVTTFTIEELLPLIQQTVEVAQIKNAYICFYEKVDHKPSRKSKLILAINGNLNITVENDTLFNSNLLLPENLFSLLKHSIVKPLFFKNDYFGYIILEDNSDYGFIYESIRSQISSALAGSWQLKKRKMAEIELHETIKHLQKTQGELAESQKMAALGTVVAGIAHEMNTPLGICITADSFISREMDSIIDLNNEKQLKQSDLDRFFLSLKQSNRLICDNLKKATDLIDKFKEISTEKSLKKKRSVNVFHLLNNMTEKYSQVLNEKNNSLEIQCDEDIRIISYPEEFRMIFSNLLSNSIIHGFENETDKKILITAKICETNLIMTYSDNGKGVKKENINKIFDPFFTTKRTTGGPGLGLHLVYNSITQILGGTIKFNSQAESGVSFYITIPIDTISLIIDKT